MKLVVRSGADAGKVFPVTKRQITIGRDPGNDVVLRDALVSRRHARIHRQDGRWVVVDLGSRNGTFVNDVRIKAPHPLSPGVNLRLGHTHLVVHDGLETRPNGHAGPIPTGARALSFVIAGLVAGTVMALLSSLPVVSLGNWLGGMWLWGSGFLGVWILSRLEANHRVQVGLGEGLAVGWLAGFMGAAVTTVINLPFARSNLMELLPIPQNLIDPSLAPVLNTIAAWLFRLQSFFRGLGYPLLGAVGGGIGAVVLGKRNALEGREVP